MAFNTSPPPRVLSSCRLWAPGREPQVQEDPVVRTLVATYCVTLGKSPYLSVHVIPSEGVRVMVPIAQAAVKSR